jgi:hypothetical protein
MSSAFWQLEGQRARFSHAGWQASIDLAKPSGGIALTNPSTVDARGWQILGVELDAPIDPRRLDAYVRGHDLVATYDEMAPRNLRAQIYWRQIDPRDCLEHSAEHIKIAFDLIVSVNTSLLDSDPRCQVVSKVSNAESLWDSSSADSVIIRPEVGEFSYVEIAHPADCCQSVVEQGHGRAGVARKLFQQRLEKGVILRARVRALVVARDQDQTVGSEAYQHFAATEPPLTV